VRTSKNGLEHVTMRTVVFPTCETHNDSAVNRKPGSLIEWCGFHKTRLPGLTAANSDSNEKEPKISKRGIDNHRRL
jgi:hypothetical protein